jgi:hypothetical protein
MTISSPGKELGLLQAELHEQSQAVPERQTFAADSMEAILDPAIPPLTVGTTGLVGRDEILYQLRERLCSGKTLVLTALNTKRLKSDNGSVVNKRDCEYH